MLRFEQVSCDNIHVAGPQGDTLDSEIPNAITAKLDELNK